MKQKPQVDTRIVSKGEYVKAQSKKAWAVTQAVGVVLGAVTVLGFLIHYQILDSRVFGPIAYIIAFAVFSFAGRQVRIIHAIEPVTPLTRANTGCLPAPDSLVRASQEPTQVQKDILLRAAVGDTQSKNEGHLFRASVGE